MIRAVIGEVEGIGRGSKGKAFRPVISEMLPEGWSKGILPGAKKTVPTKGTA